MRLFIGIPVPASATYGDVRQDLLAFPSARPVPPGTWHVTLRFLGEVLDAAPVVAALEQACRGRPSMPAVVEGLGAFPNAKHARVAWAGVRAVGIEALAAAVVEATAQMGEPPERRAFVAHATLARFGRPADLRALVDRHKDTLFAQGALDHVVLFRSTSGPGGSTYEAMHSVRVGPQA